MSTSESETQKNKVEYNEWVWEFHNKVNKQLEKDNIDWDDAVNTYRSKRKRIEYDQWSFNLSRYGMASYGMRDKKIESDTDNQSSQSE